MSGLGGKQCPGHSSINEVCLVCQANERAEKAEALARELAEALVYTYEIGDGRWEEIVKLLTRAREMGVLK